MQTISEAAAYTLQFINQTIDPFSLPGKQEREKPHFTGNYSNHAQEYGCCGANRNCGFKCWRSYDSPMFQLPFEDLFQIIHRLNFLKVPFETKATLQAFQNERFEEISDSHMELLIIDEEVCFVQIY
jgi:hypothetical protein